MIIEVTYEAVGIHHRPSVPIPHPPSGDGNIPRARGLLDAITDVSGKVDRATAAQHVSDV